MQKQGYLTLPKIKLKDLDEFSTLLLIKLAQLIDKQPETSVQLYHLIEQSLIRETKDTLFAAQLQKLQRKQNKKRKKSKRKKEKNERHKKIKQITKLYRKKFKIAYEKIFFNIWVKVLLKNYQFSLLQLNKDQTKLVKRKQKRILSRQKQLSANLLQRLNAVISVMFEGKILNPKSKYVKKKIVNFLKVTEKLQKQIKPPQKVNTVLKNIMFQLLTNSPLEEKNQLDEKDGQANIFQDDCRLVYEAIEGQVLRKFIKDIPQKKMLEQIQGSLLEQQTHSQNIYERQSNTLFEQQSLSLLKPLTKRQNKIQKKQNKANKTQNQLEKQTQKQKNVKNDIYNSYCGQQKTSGYLQLPKLNNYSQFYSKFNTNSSKIQAQKKYVDSMLIHSSIQDDQGRQRAYQQSLKWNIKQCKPSQKTHLSYFHVKSYFCQNDLDEEQKIQFKKHLKNQRQFQQQKQNQEDKQVQQIIQQKDQYKNVKRNVKLSSSNRQKSNLRQAQSKSNKQCASNSKDLNTSRAFQQVLMEEYKNKLKLMKNHRRQKYQAYSEPICNYQSKKSENNLSEDDHRQTKSQKELFNHNQNFYQNRKFLGKKQQEMSQILSRPSQKIQQKNMCLNQQAKLQDSINHQVKRPLMHVKELYPRAHGTHLPLIYQYRPNLPPNNPNFYTPILSSQQIKNSNAIKQVNESYKLDFQQQLKKINLNLQLPNVMRNLQSFGWLQIEKQERKLDEAFQCMKNQSNRSNKNLYFQDTQKSQKNIFNGNINNYNQKSNQSNENKSNFNEVQYDENGEIFCLDDYIDKFIKNYFMKKNWNLQMKRHLAEAYLENQSIVAVKKKIKNRIKADLLNSWLEQQINRSEQKKQFELKRFLLKYSFLSEENIKSSWILHKLYDLVNQIFYEMRNNILESYTYNNPNNTLLYMSYKIIKKFHPFPSSISVNYLQKNSLLQAQIRKLNLNEIPKTQTWIIDRPSFPILLKPNAIEMNLYLLKYFAENKQNQAGYVQKIGWCLEKMQIMQNFK